ncbi:MAG: hypothetical protein MJZ26_12790 [Fibrobacter sp.]|nr:hypothetical protein [Fibrobacter sp.]
MNLRKFVLILVEMFFLAGTAFAEKSMWQKFKDFFNPGESIDCEGTVCDQIHNLDEKISKAEGKYSRERRPVNKERYKKELDSLNVVRDSLVAIVKEQQAADSLKAAVSSVAEAQSSSSQTMSSSDVVAVAAVCKPDTVFVRDTIRIHDTLYVMLANKPEPVASSSSAADTTTTPAK